MSLITLVACGDTSPKGEGPYAELVAEFVPKIEKETGLPFKTPPKIESRTRDEVAKFVRQQLESERARTQLAGQESAYKLLGMVPDTMNLLALLQKLLEEQIVGYYDPATKVLYVVDGAAPVLLRQTVSHELVHALQDQYVKIDSVQAQVDNADRQSAAQSVLEGQAVFLQLRMDPNAGPMLKMPGGWDRIRDAMKDAQTGMPVFSAAPRAVREEIVRLLRRDGLEIASETAVEAIQDAEGDLLDAILLTTAPIAPPDGGVPPEALLEAWVY